MLMALALAPMLKALDLAVMLMALALALMPMALMALALYHCFSPGRAPAACRLAVAGRAVSHLHAFAYARPQGRQLGRAGVVVEGMAGGE